MHTVASLSCLSCCPLFLWNTFQGRDLARVAGTEVMARLTEAGLKPLAQRPLPILNTSYNENSFSYWLAKMTSSFVSGRNSVTADDASNWLAEFSELDEKGEYFFCATPVITEAIKVS